MEFNSNTQFGIMEEKVYGKKKTKEVIENKRGKKDISTLIFSQF